MTKVPNIVTVTSTVTHTARCSSCSQENSGTDLRTVHLWRDEHERMHARYAERGEAIAAEVFDTDAPGVPWFGVLNAAVDHAKALGLRYVTWNGMVYKIDGPGQVDFLNPVCFARDVPTTVAANR